MHKKIVQKRKKLKITQKDLAKRTGIRQQDISRIENGSNVTIKTLTRIGNVLKLRPIMEDIEPYCRHVFKAEDCELWLEDKKNCIDCANF